MSHSLRILPAALLDIEIVLRFTRQRFGARKCAEYRDLIRSALDAIAANPNHPRARARPEIHDQARTLHISQPGRRTRHFLLFRIGADNVVEVARLLYDGMDITLHLPEGYRAESDDLPPE